MLGGVKLAQSRGSSATADLLDVAMCIRAFEEMNGCRVIVEVSSGKAGAWEDVILQALAMSSVDDPMGVRVLASVQSTLSATRLRTFDAALMHILYMLDGQLAWQEMRSAEIKKQ
jgi:hypothetical protein